MVKNPPSNAGDIRDTSSIPGSGRSPGGGHGNPLQYSCLENSLDRGAWRATVHGVAQSWKCLKRLSSSSSSSSKLFQEGFLGGATGKESTCPCRRHKGCGGLIPGSGRSPGGGHGNPLQYSCLEKPMDRGAWRATVHRVAKNHIRPN